MRRIVVLSASGIAAIVMALLLVSDGGKFRFALTFQDCVQYQPIDSSARPPAVHHPIVGSTCVRWAPRPQPWLFAWGLESGLVSTFIAMAASLTLAAHRPQ